MINAEFGLGVSFGGGWHDVAGCCMFGENDLDMLNLTILKHLFHLKPMSEISGTSFYLGYFIKKRAIFAFCGCFKALNTLPQLPEAHTFSEHSICLSISLHNMYHMV